MGTHRVELPATCTGGMRRPCAQDNRFVGVSAQDFSGWCQLHASSTGPAGQVAPGATGCSKDLGRAPRVAAFQRVQWRRRNWGYAPTDLRHPGVGG